LGSSDRIWKWIFILGCCISSLLTVIPGRSPAIDEEFFKAAGQHWAATGQFVAPEIIGRIEVKPGLDEIYFAQPPGYTFLFGVYTKVVGFGPLRCILFDVLIHLLLVLLTILLARRLFHVPPAYAYAIGTFLLTIATVGRPDELAMGIGILGILAWTLDISPSRRAILSGIAFGICGSTSVGVFLFFSIMAFLVGYQYKALRISTFLLAIVSGAIVACCCVAPILISHPDAYMQLLVHASVQSPELGEAVDAGQSRVAGILHSYVGGARSVVVLHSAIVFTILGALGVIALCMPKAKSDHARMLRQCVWLAIGELIFEWLLLPGKATYLWFFAPWLLSIAAAYWVQLLPERRARLRIPVAAVVVVCGGIVVLQYAKDRASVLLAPKDQSFTANMDRVRALIPAGSTVVTLEYWWALADKCKVLDPDFSHPNPIVADYYIETGNGAGKPGTPLKIQDYYEDYARDHKFVVIENDLNKTAPHIAGIRIANSAYGFGPLVLANPETTGHTAMSPEVH
jgi:hypothetical protein